MDEKIKWAPKVKQAKLRRLYQLDAAGIVDEDLLNVVASELYSRCHSVILVSNAELECPRCTHIIHLGRKPSDKPDDRVFCTEPGCGWSVTRGQYHNSWRHQDLIGNNAEPAFRKYLEYYRSNLPPNEKMALIDQLIQAFHQGVLENVGHRTAANNIIEGNHKQVVAFLERLAGNELIAKNREGWEEWKNKANTMKRSRSKTK